MQTVSCEKISEKEKQVVGDQQNPENIMNGNRNVKSDQWHFGIWKLHADPCGDEQQAEQRIQTMPKSYPAKVEINSFFRHNYRLFNDS